jgi:hypothetical protein
MVWWQVVLLLATLVVLVDRIMTRLETYGFVSWRWREPTGGAAALGMLALPRGCRLPAPRSWSRVRPK